MTFALQLRRRFDVVTENIVGKPSDGEAFAGYVKAPVKVELKLQF